MHSFFSVVLLFFGFSSIAGAASAPILIKRTTESYLSGKVRTIDCAVSVDGVVIDREFDGVKSTEVKSYKIAGSIEAKMDDVAATKAETRKTAPIGELGYSILAFRTSAAGTRDALVLSSYDGVRGEETHNPSTGAAILRDILNSACNK